jgi:hypothetical protein
VAVDRRQKTRLWPDPNPFALRLLAMGELSDVIVVGVTDRTQQGVWRVASEVSRLTGLDATAVQQAVTQGPVRVFAAVDNANAENIRQALQTAGAVVELRPPASGAGADVAGGSDQGATAVGHVSHQATQGGAGGDWAAALDVATSDLDEFGLAGIDGSMEVDDSASLRADVGPTAQGRKGQEMDARFGGALAQEQRAARPAKKPDSEVVPGGGDDHQLVPGAPEFNDEELELDLGQAKVSRPAPVERPAEVETRPPSESSGAAPLSETSGVEGQPELPEAGRVFASPAPAPVVRLLGSDPITVALLAACIGLWVGLLPAIKAARGVERDEILPREEELERVIDRPLAVRAGKVTSPDEIARELKEVYGGIRSLYYLTWLGIAVPIGLILGFVKRPGA